MVDEMQVPIRSESDIVAARQQGRALAAQLAFSGSEQVLITTAISEVARNIIQYAREGKIILRPIRQRGKHGLVVIAQDSGPGIPDITKAMQDGYSTGGGLGMGLPGARRLMDEFDIVSQVGQGTIVTMTKWKY